MARLKWDERELPILEAIADYEAHQSAKVPRIDTLVELTGLERLSVLLGLRALIEAGYVSAADAGASYHDGADFTGIDLRERGRRVVGQWPGESAGEELLELISERADGAATEEERSSWRRLFDAGKAVGGKTLTEVLTAYIKHYTGP